MIDVTAAILYLNAGGCLGLHVEIPSLALTFLCEAGYHRNDMAEAEGAKQARTWLAVKAILISVRPHQWTKNLIIYFAFFFTVDQAWRLAEMGDVTRLFMRTTGAFAVFCLATSCIYLFNDVLDAERDRQHPKKRHRPIASGMLSPVVALASALSMATSGIYLALILEPLYALIVLIYLGLMVAYSVYLKRLIIVDVIVISAGFVMRAVAGAVVMDVTISPWLYICTSLGALFLGFTKRLNELVLSEGTGHLQRQTLEEYSPRLLEQLISIVAPATLVSYILYTFTADNLPANNAMMLTIPFVMYGLFRYLYLVHHKNLGENPEQILLRDIPLILNIVLWLTTASSVLVLYR